MNLSNIKIGNLLFAFIFCLLSLANGYLFIENGLLISLIAQAICLIIAIIHIRKGFTG